MLQKRSDLDLMQDAMRMTYPQNCYFESTSTFLAGSRELSAKHTLLQASLPNQDDTAMAAPDPRQHPTMSIQLSPSLFSIPPVDISARSQQNRSINQRLLQSPRFRDECALTGQLPILQAETPRNDVHENIYNQNDIEYSMSGALQDTDIGLFPSSDNEDIEHCAPGEDWSWMHLHKQPVIHPQRLMLTQNASHMAEEAFDVMTAKYHDAQAIIPISISDSELNEASQLQQHDYDTISQESGSMEISPEDEIAPTFAQTNELRLFYTAHPNPTSLLDSRETSARPVLVESSYQKDHRGFQVHPVQHYLSGAKLPEVDEVLNGSSASLQNYHNAVVDPVKPRRCRQYCSSSGLSTPGHMTPAEHSPLKHPDTPRPVLTNIHPSVERDLSPLPWNRESTPAYEDRSLTPSPVSYTDELGGKLASDAAMLDVSAESDYRNIRCSSTPIASPRLALMLPPSSLNKSRTSSPQSSSYDVASPSMLRSPAIARVLDQSQSPHRQTHYPFPRYRSLSPVHYFRYQSPPRGSVMQSVEPAAAPNDLRMVDATMVDDPAADQNTAILLPPPIPDDPVPIKLLKRGGLKQSVLSTTHTKIAKSRSVTNSALVPSNDARVAGRRTITTGRQRAVTQRLLKAVAGSEDKFGDTVSLEVQAEGEGSRGRIRRSARLKGNE